MGGQHLPERQLRKVYLGRKAEYSKYSYSRELEEFLRSWHSLEDDRSLQHMLDIVQDGDTICGKKIA